jgi:hypothetical protein
MLVICAFFPCYCKLISFVVITSFLNFMPSLFSALQLNFQQLPTMITKILCKVIHAFKLSSQQ